MRNKLETEKTVPNEKKAYKLLKQSAMKRLLPIAMNFKKAPKEA